MHVNAKKTAFCGVMLALAEIMIFLSGIIEMNTLFLLAVAAFTVGLAAYEFNMKYGLAYLIASVLLGFILAPNKLYCITYAAMGIYVLADEGLWLLLQRAHTAANKNVLLWILKFAVFNVMYLPMLIFFPKLLFTGEMSMPFILGAVVLGQAAMVLFDRAYDYFQRVIWNKYRKILN